MIVGNAVQAEQNDKSRTLSKMLMPGPDTLPQIMELVMRFMTFEYVFLIDIQKMFLSIELLPQVVPRIDQTTGSVHLQPTLHNC